MRNKLELGKCDYNRSGRKNCKAVIEWELKEGRFSMTAEIWNPRETDIYCGGQCVDEVAGYFKGNKKAQRMAEVWKRWHLNDMKAGCVHQRALGWDKDGYDKHPSEPCPTCGYKYGSAWLKEELPQEVIAEIESWKQ